MRFRNGLQALLVATCAVVACHGKTPPPRAPEPPVAPIPPPAAPPPTAPAPVPPPDEYSRIRALDIDAINRLGLLQDVHFDFDKADIRDGDKPILARNAEQLRKYDFLRVTVEGHGDERGTVEYNLALGDRRARAVYDYLVSLGTHADNLKAISYGKESPTCQEHNEDCWAINRRGHFTVTGKDAVR